MSLLTKFRDRLNSLGTRSREHGNSLVVVIMLFPVMFGVFGTATDLAIATYTQSTLQSALDNGAQSALSRALNPGEVGNKTLAPKLTPQAAETYFRQFYDQNRADVNDNSNPFLKCQKTVPSSGGVFVVPPSGCAYTEKAFNFSITGNTLQLNATVYETSSTVFLHILGVDEIKYTLHTSARTTFSTQ